MFAQLKDNPDQWELIPCGGLDCSKHTGNYIRTERWPSGFMFSVHVSGIKDSALIAGLKKAGCIRGKEDK